MSGDTETATMINFEESKPGPSHANVNGGLDLSCHTSASKPQEESQEPVQQSKSPNKPSNTSNTNNSPSKPKKRKKCLRDSKAPEKPLTGYFRFLNDRREKLRTENPSLQFAEITKQLAAEWNVLPADQKKQYLDAAEQDKERYVREFNEYKQTDSYKAFLEKQKEREKQKDDKKGKGKLKDKQKQKQNDSQKESKKEKNGPSEKKSPKKKTNDDGDYEIPIFTDQFLDHNKECETQLRHLRKVTTDHESQNAVLQRHVDSLHTAVKQTETDTDNLKETNQVLLRHLDALRTQLVSCFSSIPLSGTQGATLDSIDSYMDKLDSLMESNLESTQRNALKAAVSRVTFSK